MTPSSWWPGHPGATRPWSTRILAQSAPGPGLRRSPGPATRPPPTAGRARDADDPAASSCWWSCPTVGWASWSSVAAATTRSAPRTEPSRGCTHARSRPRLSGSGRRDARASALGVRVEPSAAGGAEHRGAADPPRARPSEIGAAICSETRQVVPYDNARVHVLAADGETLEAVAFSHHTPEYAMETAETLRLRVGEGITGWVVAAGAGRHRARCVAPSQGRAGAGHATHPRRRCCWCRCATRARLAAPSCLSRVGTGGFVAGRPAPGPGARGPGGRGARECPLAGQSRPAGPGAGGAPGDQPRGLHRSTTRPASRDLVADILVRTSAADGCVVSRWDEPSAMLEVLGVAGSPRLVRPRCARGDLARLSADASGVLLEGEPQLVRLATAWRGRCRDRAPAPGRREPGAAAAADRHGSHHRPPGAVPRDRRADLHGTRRSRVYRSMAGQAARRRSRTCSCCEACGPPRTWTRSRASTTTATCRSGSPRRWPGAPARAHR